MNKKNLIILLFISYIATFLRFYINNNILVSTIGSFIYGFVIARKISNSEKEILLSGFCSCLTSFSGFILILYQLLIKGYYFKLFFYLNFIVIFNLLIMYFGYSISRKMT